MFDMFELHHTPYLELSYSYFKFYFSSEFNYTIKQIQSKKRTSVCRNPEKMILNVKENKFVHLFYNTPKLFDTFRIISDPLKPFAPNSLGPLQLLQKHFLLFFWP